MFPFAPSPEHIAFGHHPFAYWDEGFSEEALQELSEAVDDVDPQDAVVGKGVKNPEYRSSTVRWLNPHAVPMFSSILADIVRKLNGECYGFDLWGFGEALQHTTYEAPEGFGRMKISVPEAYGHYDWHMDIGDNTDMCRKLSAVTFLNDDYEGGDLQVMMAAEPITIEKKPGRVIVFPSYHLHRVTPVTKGTRKTLVSWVSGPKFR